MKLLVYTQNAIYTSDGTWATFRADIDQIIKSGGAMVNGVKPTRLVKTFNVQRAFIPIRQINRIDLVEKET